MASTMWVNLIELRSGADDVARVSDALDSTRNRLSLALDQEGPCWGSDEMGTSFGQSYASVALQTRDAFGDLAAAVQSIAAGLRVAADNVEHTDGRGESRFNGEPR